MSIIDLGSAPGVGGDPLRDSLAVLSAFARRSVEARQTTPPTGLTDDTSDVGRAWIVDASASGDWAGAEGKLAVWIGEWRLITVPEGHVFYVQDEDVDLRADGADSWTTAFANADTAVQPGDLAAIATSGDAADLTGTLPNGVFPATLPAADGSNLTNINAVQSGDLAAVATSGDAADLTGLAAIATSGDAADLTGTLPNGVFPATLPAADGSNLTNINAVQPGDLATVATTGAYSDLIGLPTLGTAAATDASDYATAAQGGLADTAVQPGDLATVATTGAAADLTGLATVATSGSYNDLSDLPTAGTFAGSIVVESSVGNTISLETSVANGNDAEFRIRKSRVGGSIVSGDDIGTIRFQGHDGSGFVDAAVIQADSTATTGNLGGVLTFDTNGAERVRIDENGNVGIGTFNPSTTLHVGGPARVGSYTVATVPSASTVGAGTIIYVSNETGGAVLAFSDGTNWRRVTDRATIS